jgi:hypothetical protein
MPTARSSSPKTAVPWRSATVRFTRAKAEALADTPRICEQHEVAGSGQFIFNRQAADDYEGALKLAGGVTMLELAKFWRLHTRRRSEDRRA